jgi:formylglycine-generating enzyme required for sulfatase activity
MRIAVLHRHLLPALVVGALLLAGATYGLRPAAAQGTSAATIGLTMQPGQTIQLMSLGTALPLVWTIKEGPVGGTITKEGRYVAPLAPGTYHIALSPKAGQGKTIVFTVVVKPGGATTEPAMGSARLYPLPGGGVMRMRYVPAGAFAMGNTGQGDDATLGGDEERPQHNVTLSGYWIGKCEVTRGQYRQFMKAGGYTKQSYWSPEGWTWLQDAGRAEPADWAVDAEWANPPGPFKQTDDHPVIGINYFEAQAFCRWAGLRLPSEAEWEKAARWDGQHSLIYPWGDEWDAQRCNNAQDALFPGGQSAPIARYPQGASACGALDMAGNVWEWVQDWFGAEYYLTSPGTNPQGPPASDLRGIRGGSWFGSNWVGPGEDDRLRSAQRAGFDPYNTSGAIGFRCAVTTMPASAK